MVGITWREPYAEIVAVGLTNGEIIKFAIQSIIEDLKDYLKFVKNEK